MKNALRALSKSWFGRFANETSYAPKWSVIGGVVTMVSNAATIPVLYFILEKKAFAEWVTALACLNLWCFPESARNLLITSGYQKMTDGKNALSYKFLAVAGLFAMGTLLLHILGMRDVGTASLLWRELAPLIMLMLAIPLRFRLAEFRGVLQANGQWRLHASLVSGVNLMLSLTIILTALLTKHVMVIAAVYVVMLFVQIKIFGRMVGNRSSQVVEFKSSSESTTFVGAMALSLGPLLFSQGDKVGLRFVLGDTQFAEYAFYVAIAGQINVVGALPCIPLAAWFRQLPEKRLGLLQTAQKWNLISVSVIMFGICAGYLMLKTVFPGLVYSKLSGTLLFCTASIYGLISLNAPAYFLMIGQGHYRVVGWVNLLLAILSLGAIMLLGRSYGIHGAIMGNIVFGLTVLWGVRAYRRVGGPKTGWLLGGLAALCMFILSFAFLILSS